MFRTRPTSVSRAVWKMILGFAGISMMGGMIGAATAPNTHATLQPPPAPTLAETTPADVQTKAQTISGDYEAMVAAQGPSKQTLLDALKDGGTAKIKDVIGVKVDLDGTTVYAFCGEVNAKSSYGAYGGYERFVAGPAVAGTAETIEGFDTIWDRFCAQGSVIMRNVPFQNHLLG